MRCRAKTEYQAVGARLAASPQDVAQRRNIRRLAARLAALPQDAAQRRNIRRLACGSQLRREMSRKGGISGDWHAVRSFAARCRAKTEYRAIGMRFAASQRDVAQRRNIARLAARFAASARDVAQRRNIRRLAARFAALPQDVAQRRNIARLAARLAASPQEAALQRFSCVRIARTLSLSR